jgi:site-specific DNA-methyltransferase (adenine-specific)
VLPTLSADVLVTDPPYGLEQMAGSYGRHGDTIANDRDTSVRDDVLQLWGTRPALVFGSPRLPEPPGGWDHRLVWDKAEPGLNGGPWRYNHEPIFVRGEGWVRVSASSFSVLRFAAQNGAAGRAEHPHRKPLGLLQVLLSAAPDGAVLDPFMGGGTTLRAAKDLGRRAIGIEIDERYCEVAAQRCAQEVLAV